MNHLPYPTADDSQLQTDKNLTKSVNDLVDEVTDLNAVVASQKQQMLEQQQQLNDLALVVAELLDVEVEDINMDTPKKLIV